MTQYKQTFIGELPIDTFPFLYLGKAILQEPEWLLMDDPFDNMSVTARKKMIGILLNLHEKGTSTENQHIHVSRNDGFYYRCCCNRRRKEPDLWTGGRSIRRSIM